MKRMVFGVVTPALCTTRVRILQALGKAGGSLRLASLMRQLEIPDSTLRAHLRRLQHGDVIEFREGAGRAPAPEVRLVRAPHAPLSCGEAAVFEFIWKQCETTNFREGIPTRDLVKAGWSAHQANLHVRLLARAGWIEAHHAGTKTIFVAPSCFAVANHFLAARTNEIVRVVAERLDAPLRDISGGTAEC